MANQDYGRGQQYDEDTTNDQWAQQGGQQQYDQSNQDVQGQQYDVDPGGQGTMPDPWSQQGGLSEDPLSQDSPFGEGEQQGQGMSRRDRAEQGDIDSAFGNP
jgi:hypothetical protein